MKRAAAILLAALLGLCAAPQAGAEKVITLSFAGDCTLGSEEITRNNPDSFDNTVREQGYDYFFANFQDLFSTDDCTVVNLEVVLSDTAGGEVTTKTYRFRGAEHFVNILKAGSIEAVSLGNNHTKDYSTRGLKNTMRVLEEAGIGWARAENLWIYEKDDIRIAFVSLDYYAFINSATPIRKKLDKMRANGEINATVLLLHLGDEYSPTHGSEQFRIAEWFINRAKGDLVIIHHPHVLQGIGIINNRSVFYSLGNFVFGGYHKVTLGETTNSLYTIAVQVRMHFADDGTYLGQQAVIYPAYDSGEYPENNYQPVRVTPEEAGPVVKAIQLDTPWQLPEVQTDGNGKAFITLDYLPANGNAE